MKTILKRLILLLAVLLCAVGAFAAEPKSLRRTQDDPILRGLQRRDGSLQDQAPAGEHVGAIFHRLPGSGPG